MTRTEPNTPAPVSSSEADIRAALEAAMPPLPKNDHAFMDPEDEMPDILVWRESSMRAYGLKCVAAYAAALRAAVQEMTDAQIDELWTQANLSGEPFTSRLFARAVLKAASMRPAKDAK